MMHVSRSGCRVLGVGGRFYANEVRGLHMITLTSQLVMFCLSELE